MSHTPGPWFNDEYFVRVIKPEREYLGAGAAETICEMQSSVSPEETCYNQILIAAAPDLLEAVQECMRRFKHFEFYEDEASSICKILRPVIAKATGGAV